MKLISRVAEWCDRETIEWAFGNYNGFRGTYGYILLLSFVAIPVYLLDDFIDLIKGDA